MFWFVGKIIGYIILRILILFVIVCIIDFIVEEAQYKLKYRQSFSKFYEYFGEPIFFLSCPVIIVFGLYLIYKYIICKYSDMIFEWSQAIILIFLFLFSIAGITLRIINHLKNNKQHKNTKKEDNLSTGEKIVLLIIGISILLVIISFAYILLI